MNGCVEVWPTLAHQPELKPGNVHVWRAVLDQSEAVCCELEGALSPDERARAARFHFPHDRRRFTVARGVLRHIIGAYLGVQPDAVQFKYGRLGKPALDAGAPPRRLCFNTSHSRTLALFALSRDRELGVDVEYMRAVPDAAHIAERFFSKSENAALKALPPEQQHEAFFTCWTRKEAYIKAIGDGLSRPLHGFEVSLSPGEPARLTRVDGDEYEAHRWSMLDLAPGPGYRGALVAEGECPHLSCFTFPLPGGIEL